MITYNSEKITEKARELYVNNGIEMKFEKVPDGMTVTSIDYTGGIGNFYRVRHLITDDIHSCSNKELFEHAVMEAIDSQVKIILQHRMDKAYENLDSRIFLPL